jgi:hypothetical protein
VGSCISCWLLPLARASHAQLPGLSSVRQCRFLLLSARSTSAHSLLLCLLLLHAG